MRLWTIFKLLAALFVLAVMGFTGLMVYHMTVRPLGGVFEKIVPRSSQAAAPVDQQHVMKMLAASAEAPTVDPGERAFQKASEEVAMGHLPEARAKLENLIMTYPMSPAASQARHILGEMNLDELLTPKAGRGKSVYTVQKGDSFLAIAGKNKTSLDLIFQLNGLMDASGLQPGDELVVAPLTYKLLIEPHRRTLSLWDGGRFVVEFPLVRLQGAGLNSALKTTVASKVSVADNKRIGPGAKAFRNADKAIHLAKGNLRIRSWVAGLDDSAHGLFISPQDMEELFLLTNLGNEVEIRLPAR